MGAGLGGLQCPLPPTPPIYLLLLQLQLVWPLGQASSPNSPFPEPEGQEASPKELDQSSKSGAKLACVLITFQRIILRHCRRPGAGHTPQGWFNLLWPDWPNVPSLGCTHNHSIPMATGRTFIQQTFPPLSIPQVTSNSLIFYPNSSVTCLPLSLLHLTQTWPPLIYLRSHITRPHCLAQAPQRPPELMQLPPHSPSSPALFPIKAGLILPFPCCTSLCFASEAKSQPWGQKSRTNQGA